jgi:hypothetical protein
VNKEIKISAALIHLMENKNIKFFYIKKISFAAALLAGSSLFSPAVFAACIGYGGDITINADNSTTNITTQINSSSRSAVSVCATGSTINITSSGSIIGTGEFGIFLPPRNAPSFYTGDPTGVLNNEGSINKTKPIVLNNEFGTINNGSALGSTASIRGTGDIAIYSASGGDNYGALTTLNNYGSISSSGGIFGAVYFQGSQVGSVVNYGTITGSGGPGVFVAGTSSSSSSLNLLTNHGTITSNGGSFGAVAVRNVGTAASIVTINNYGSLVGTITIPGIWNGNATLTGGAITTLNNQQGAGNTNGALTYSGVLPVNYNVIIRGLSEYGQLSVTLPSGSTAFGILAGSTVNANGRYLKVLQGFSSLGSVTNATGTYSTYNYSLVANSSSADAWDLCFGDCSVIPAPPAPVGPSTVNTQQSLVNTASQLQNTYTLQNSVLANSFSYDCTVFGANNVCVSAGGRNTAVSAANGLNNTSALLIAAYRLNKNYRIGAYADQNLSVSNPGGTVNLGNNTPLIGLFGAWSQRLDGIGAEVKVSAAYGQKNTTVNRSVVGSGATASEAGSGSSQLNSQGAQVTAKYGFAVTDNAIVSPYVGVRYTQNNMGGYTEGTSSSVTAPLTYSALNTNATTALAGVGASYKVIPTVTAFASAGVETDTNAANGSYSATGVTGLTPVNFNANPVRTRPTATLGAYYDIAKNQRLGITGIYRQESYQAISTTTVLATYTIGL